MIELKRILLVEDNANDIELTISALEEYNLANGIDTALQKRLRSWVRFGQSLMWYRQISNLGPISLF